MTPSRLSIPKAQIVPSDTSQTAYLTRLVSDFVFFCEQLWIDRKLDAVAPLGDVERDICRYAAYGPQRQVVLAPRGFGKTHLVTGGLACWDLYCNPQHKILIVSKSETEAKKTLRLVREWIEHVAFLKHLCPDRDQRDSATQFDVGPAKSDRTPSVTAKGIDGQIEGTRAHRLIADDVETTGNTKTLDSRHDLAHRVMEFTSIATYGKRLINYVGTPHHEESLYLSPDKLPARNYAVRTWPLLYPHPTEKVVGLAPMLQKRLDDGVSKPGDIVCPYRFDQQYITERRAEGRTYFAMQQMLVADLGDTLRYPLQLRDLIVFPVNRDRAPATIQWGTSNAFGASTRIEDILSLGFDRDGFYHPIFYDPAAQKYSGTKMWIDPAGRGADSTGYSIIAQLNGYLWVKACGGLTGGYEPQTLEKLAQLAKLHRARNIYCEDNFGQGMFVQLFEPVLAKHFIRTGDPNHIDNWSTSIETVRVTGQKEVRIIDALEPVMNQHRLVVDIDVAKNEIWQRQLTRITRQRNSLEHEDELESMAMCVAMWQDAMNQNPQKSAERKADQLIDDQLKAHRQAMGVQTVEPNWVTHF